MTVGAEAREIDCIGPSTHAADEWLSTDLSIEGEIVVAQSDEKLVEKLTVSV